MKTKLFRKGMKILSLSFSAAILLLLASCSKDENLGSDVQKNQLKSTNYYQCWTAGGGSVTCQNLSGGHYKVNWSRVNDIVVGKGYSGYSGTMSWSGWCSGCAYFGVYGWMRSPLTEFYVGRGGGTNCGSYSTSKGNYTLNTVQCNGANINGSGPFHQYNCSGSGSSGINLQQHYSGWSSKGKGASSPAYCIVAVEAWGSSSGSADVTVN
jgi:endo-1,4-beta-xylanase